MKLSETDREAVSAVAGLNTAWPLRTLAESLCGAESVAGLIAGGWLAAWDHPGVDGERVVLTPIAAERLNVSLDEFEDFGAPRWVGGSPWGEWGKVGGGRPIKSPRYAREVPMWAKVVRVLLDPKPEPNRDYYLEETVIVDGDEVTRPVELFGLRVPIDNRLRGKRRKAG